MAYAFIDGAALLQFVNDAAQRIAPGADTPINYERLLNKLGEERTFFYDAYPSKKSNESEDDFKRRWEQKDILFRRLSRIDSVHVRTGLSRHRKGQGLQQKGVDIQLAIDMFQHAVYGNINQAVLVANDLDFYPLLEVLTRTRVKSVLRYDLGKTSVDLIEAADKADPLSLVEFANWCGLNAGSLNYRKLHSNEKSMNFDVLEEGTLDARTLTIYRAEEHQEMFWIEHSGSNNWVICENKAVGIDFLEREIGKRAEL